MEPCLYPSYRAVTRPQFLLQLGTKSITQFTSHLGSSQIQLDVHMGMQSFRSHSFLYQKVRCNFFVFTYISNLIPYCSKQTPTKAPRISKLRPAGVPHVPGPNFRTTLIGNDHPRGCPLPWWSFPESDLHSWAVYCWLSWTSLVGRNCSRLVSKVHIQFIMYIRTPWS